jgi:hypothetical protein
VHISKSELVGAWKHQEASPFGLTAAQTIEVDLTPGWRKPLHMIDAGDLCVEGRHRYNRKDPPHFNQQTFFKRGEPPPEQGQLSNHAYAPMAPTMFVLVSMILQRTLFLQYETTAFRAKNPLGFPPISVTMNQGRERRGE